MTGGLILDLIVLVLLLLFVAVGAKKGLTVCLVNIFSLIIALVLAFLVIPIVEIVKLIQRKTNK